jgi:hypothetical protein
MESMGANKWLVNFDGNSTLTLKSCQIQVTEQKKPNKVVEPVQEDECHLNTSSFYFSRKSFTAITHVTTSTSATTMNVASTSTATDLNHHFEEDDDNSYIQEEEEVVDYDDELLANNLKEAEDLLTYDSDDDSVEIARGEVVTEEYEDDINEHKHQSYVSSRKIDALKGITTDVVKGSGKNKKTITWKIVT